MKRVGFFAIAFILSGYAQANYYCIGKVTYLGVSHSGVLAISNGYGVHYACNLSDEYCKAWLTFATSAKLADKEIHIYYNNASISGGNVAACSNNGDWVTPADTIYHLAF